MGWQRLGSKTVFKGRVHILEFDVVLPDGSTSTYQVEHSDGHAAATLILLQNGNLLLSRQYRFPLDREIYDLPGGSGPKSESAEDIAIRECQEEVGIAPTELHKLATFYPNPARTDWPMHVFFCNSYKESALDAYDPSEEVEKVEITPRALSRLIDNGEIVDPSLLIGWGIALQRGYIQP